jgi:uncharacterized protein (DUF1330 family)
MTAYAVAHLRSVDQNAEIVEYLRRIDATLDPYGGRFVVHGVLPHVLEGAWPGFPVVIGFPDLDAARAWYDSPAYQEILPLIVRQLFGPEPARYRPLDQLTPTHADRRAAIRPEIGLS